VVDFVLAGQYRTFTEQVRVRDCMIPAGNPRHLAIDAGIAVPNADSIASLGLNISAVGHAVVFSLVSVPFHR